MSSIDMLVIHCTLPLHGYANVSIGEAIDEHTEAGVSIGVANG